MFNFLVVGHGKMGKVHSDAILRSNDSSLWGIVDDNVKEKNQKIKFYDSIFDVDLTLWGIVDDNVKEKNQKIKFYDSIFDVDLNNNIDAVIVSSTTNSHYEIAKEVIKFNLPILIEKPVSVDIGEVKEIVKLYKTKKQILQAGFIEVFNPVVSYLKKLDIKNISKIEINRLGVVREKSRKLENVIYDLGIHDISIFDYLFGLKKTEIKSKVNKKKNEKIAEADIVFNSNNIVTYLKLSNQAGKNERFWNIYTDEFIYSADLLNKNITIKEKGKVIDNIAFTMKKEAIDLQLENFIIKLRNKSHDLNHINSIFNTHNLVDMLN